MTKRPDFTQTMNPLVFKRFYWYQAELRQICLQQGLPTTGTKAELTAYVLALLNGQAPQDIHLVRKRRRKLSPKLTAEHITLDTKLLNSGFALNQEARSFFAHYFGIQKFSFRKSMAIKMRTVERLADTSATVADLIAVLASTSATTKSAEEATYQWNNFVKDFCNDPISKLYTEPLKVAAILWQKVRDSDQPKSYRHALVVKHASELSRFLKPS
ncbi:SAP domain-containing protein [Levilactobacillus fujinensis]|uniref:SAP domain-containing protein n=1 Tax=Levilactobacillus fujinensis TaxID=2486024 RepID=A0ABW1TH98_9LACO|nr:SAP domain-containing protein [Levilactobacillus fujinensis]